MAEQSTQASVLNLSRGQTFSFAVVVFRLLSEMQRSYTDASSLKAWICTLLKLLDPC